ncbi:G2/mitotic-specific cyclin-B [Cucumispora dikerogammari]|nr:G2/mitotic-specific cyclin-B [Cucumispora dikerogammari]
MTLFDKTNKLQKLNSHNNSSNGSVTDKSTSLKNSQFISQKNSQVMGQKNSQVMGQKNSQFISQKRSIKTSQDTKFLLETNLNILLKIDDEFNITHSNTASIQNLFIIQSYQTSIFTAPTIKSLFHSSVNYLFNLCQEHNFSIETLSSSVYFIKKVIGKCTIMSNIIYTVTLCIFYIRSKYEELTVPTIDDILFKSNISKSKYINLELRILDLLEYNMNFIGGINFLRFYTKKNFYNQRDHKLSKLIYCLSLYCNFKYSELEISTGSYFLALTILNRESDWIHYYSNMEVCDTVKVSEFLFNYLMYELCIEEYKNSTVFNMFNRKENCFVGKFLLDYLVRFKVRGV